jgi:hypothetical protein
MSRAPQALFFAHLSIRETNEFTPCQRPGNDVN